MQSHKIRLKMVLQKFLLVPSESKKTQKNKKQPNMVLPSSLEDAGGNSLVFGLEGMCWHTPDHRN